MKIRVNLISALCLAAGFASSVAIAKPDAAPPAREAIEWCDIWSSHANETNLSRVLLIGDSIARDYYPEVEKRLAGKAFVARLATSRFLADPVLLKEVELVLDGTKFDVIHFNNGMHGWQHSEAEYRGAFPKVLETIRSHAPRAKLIWATTTPLKNSKPGNPAEASDERIAARNLIALECIKTRDIPVDDLNASMRGHPEYYRDDIHFNA